MQTKISESTGRLLVSAALILGTLLMFIVLAVHEIPDGNREMVLGLLGAWTLGVGLMLKRMFEGSDSSDKKNDIIASQAAALNPPPTPDAAPAAPAPSAP